MTENLENIFSLEAEQAVLGTLLMDADNFDKVADKLIPADFFKFEHRVIFDIICKLMSSVGHIDPLLVAEEIKKDEKLENKIPENYLLQISYLSRASSNILYYVKIVRDRSIARQLLKSCQEISDMILNFEYQTSEDLLEKSENKILKIAIHKQTKYAPVKINELLSKTTLRLDAIANGDEQIIGLPTSFIGFDEMTSGFQKGDLILIAARPSMGKTAFVMNMAENIVTQQNKSVLVFSLEMSGEQLTNRLISSVSHIDQSAMKSGRLNNDDWMKVSRAIGTLESSHLYVDESGSLTPTELRLRAKRLAREIGKLDLIVIDYLQLLSIPGKRENRVLEVSEISRSLKLLAKELNVPVIALSQLNRNLEQRTNRRPMMSDLRDSGGLEQDADVILFIYRDEVYNSDSPARGKAEIIVAKQRNGAIGKFRLNFFGRYTRFQNMQEAQRLYYAVKPEGN